MKVLPSGVSHINFHKGKKFIMRLYVFVLQVQMVKHSAVLPECITGSHQQFMVNRKCLH